MDYCNPAHVVAALIEAGKRKAALSVSDILFVARFRGQSSPLRPNSQSRRPFKRDSPLVGALIFPVGFVMIVLLNLELVTGSFAVMPMAQMDGAVRFSDTLRNWGWSFFGQFGGQPDLRCHGVGRIDNVRHNAGRRRGRSHRRHRRCQDAGFCGTWRRRVGRGVHQGNALQLDGLHGCRHGRRCSVHGLKDRRGLDSDLHLLRIRVRACRRQYVRYSRRHAAGRQDDCRIVVALESDSRDARKSVWRHAVHRTGSVFDLSRATKQVDFTAARRGGIRDLIGGWGNRAHPLRQHQIRCGNTRSAAARPDPHRLVACLGLDQELHFADVVIAFQGKRQIDVQDIAKAGTGVAES